MCWDLICWKYHGRKRLNYDWMCWFNILNIIQKLWGSSFKSKIDIFAIDKNKISKFGSRIRRWN